MAPRRTMRESPRSIDRMDSGVAGVVAMRYNVFVVTAAQFIGGLYDALSRGRTLGEAAALGRKQLRDQPLRPVLEPPSPRAKHR